MDISVIIVTFNSADCIDACVASVQAQSDVSFEILIVDNASADNTLARLNKLKCRVIPSAENLGFGSGCNLGFAASYGRYLYLLNPDARLVGGHGLAELCRQMDANPSWGMAGTLIRAVDGKSASPPAHDYPGQRHVHRDFSRLPGDIAWVLGASMIVRRELYEKLGGFDPGFFLYSEETDFCLRLRELGSAIGYIPGVAVDHIGGASEDPRDPYEVSTRKLKGLLRFRQKHYPADDCIFLAERDRRRARMRMIWNGLLARLQPPRSKAWREQRRYRGVWEVSRNFLKQTDAKG
ncbi:MAG: glycosyltransferase family 2 protein [Verrucomicrobiia bacterium]